MRLDMTLEELVQLPTPELAEKCDELARSGRFRRFQYKEVQLGRLVCEFFAFYVYEFDRRDVAQVVQKASLERGPNGHKYLVVQGMTH